jgi:hypothetical protein
MGFDILEAADGATAADLIRANGSKSRAAAARYEFAWCPQMKSSWWLQKRDQTSR